MLNQAPHDLLDYFAYTLFCIYIVLILAGTE